MQQATDTQVCAANSRAAMAPAMAGVGRCTNSKGTARKPMVPRLPHQSAASNAGRRTAIVQTFTRSGVADTHDLIAANTARRLHFGRVTLFLANEGTCDGAGDIDQP